MSGKKRHGFHRAAVGRNQIDGSLCAGRAVRKGVNNTNLARKTKTCVFVSQISLISIGIAGTLFPMAGMSHSPGIICPWRFDGNWAYSTPEIGRPERCTLMGIASSYLCVCWGRNYEHESNHPGAV
jgi:hypothetical protein